MTGGDDALRRIDVELIEFGVKFEPLVDQYYPAHRRWSAALAQAHAEHHREFGDPKKGDYARVPRSLRHSWVVASVPTPAALQQSPGRVVRSLPWRRRVSELQYLGRTSPRRRRLGRKPRSGRTAPLFRRRGYWSRASGLQPTAGRRGRPPDGRQGHPQPPKAHWGIPDPSQAARWPNRLAKAQAEWRGRARASLAA
jgi:hypothetical protein